MTIFQIQTNKAVEPAGTSPSHVASPDPAPGGAPSGEQHGKDDLSIARNLDADAPSGEGSRTAPESQESSARETRMITIDGPVSRIYEQALQEVFANENMAAMITPQTKVEQTPHDPSIGHTHAYIYTADTLNLQEVVKISNTITKYSGRDYIVAVEGIHTTSDHRSIGILMDMEKEGKLKLCLTRDKAISTIMDSIKP